MNNKVIAILSIIGMICFGIACLKMNTIQEHAKSFKGKKVVLMNDTLLVVGTTPLTHHVLLSNGAEIDVSIVEKYVLK